MTKAMLGTRKRIIIGLIEHIGDIVACEPVSRYVREKYPDAHISWAVRAVYRELIDTNPHINETVVLGCLTDWIRLVKHENYDEIVDLHVNYRMCDHCRIPLVKERGNPFINIHEWLDYGGLLEAFSQGAGLPKLSAQPQVYLGPEHREAVDALSLPASYCVIHRESNDTNKDWSAENWHHLADWITGELGLPIVEVGASKTVERSPLEGLAINLINQVPILQTAEVIRRARFFIGVDSGPAHLANALRVPGIVLLGRIGIFRQYTPFTGFYNSNSLDVKLVRNLAGRVIEIPVSKMIEATHYVASVITERERSPGAEMGEPATMSVTVDARDRSFVQASGLFDRSWYVVHYPEVLCSGVDAIDHFIAYGGILGFSPGPAFDAAQYLKRHPDIANAGINPLVHYLSQEDQGKDATVAYITSKIIPERLPMPSESDRAPGQSDQLNVSLQASLPSTNEIPRVFAFYFPQFHPAIQYNQGGRIGFTEWDTVIGAKPLFKGHYQPRVPGELGYYDLRAIEVMREQVSLATEHGISGFCFYHYYFSGMKPFFRPIENYLRSDIKAPFFLIWANESWSRRFDGSDDEVIVAQHHSPEDDLLFIRDILSVFADERYVKIDGKPLLLVHKTHLFPDILATTELWREEVVKHGFPGLYLVMVDDWAPDPPHPRALGFDATYEMPSNIVPEHVICDEIERLELPDDFCGRIVDYRKFTQFHMSRPFPEYKRFRTVMLPRDNAARYASKATVHMNTGGDDYQTWLTQAMLDTRNRYAPSERIVFVQSWNEWSEGTYLEPDGRFGRRYLEETRDTIASVRTVIALDKTGNEATPIALMQRLSREKDRYAFLLTQAVRSQTFYLHCELDQLRADAIALRVLQAKQALTVEDALQVVYQSRSWRASAPLRWLSRLVRGA